MKACKTTQLQEIKERGKALVFNSVPGEAKRTTNQSLTEGGDCIQKNQVFVIRFQGDLYAYENACPHTGIALDWGNGEMFDQAGRYLICSNHGALFEPDTGLCVHGPCHGQSLIRVQLREHDLPLNEGD